MLSVIIPANDEERFIGRCLEALAGQRADDALAQEGVEVVVAANACRDRTVDVARGFADRFAARGWRLIVLDLAEGGKPNALNCGDAAASGESRIYLDADVQCGPEMLAQIRGALATAAARYATGRLVVAPGRSWATRRYAAFWARLPFAAGGATGAGLFAVNARGRARWERFPDIISDDTYVRLLFAPEERVEVGAEYLWPMVEGFRSLVRVRRRQDAGTAEVRRLWPRLTANEGKARLGWRQAVGLALSDPAGSAVYGSVAVMVRLGAGATRGDRWVRGDRAPPDGGPRPVAYLTGEFPKVSHTFILREVEALRALGVPVLTCSVRRTDPSEHKGEAERAAARETFHVLEAATPLRLARDHLGALAAAPGRYAAALLLALRTRPPGLRALARQLVYFLEAGVLAAELRRRGVGRLHNHFADSSCTVAMLAAELADVPFSFTMHGPTEFFAAERWSLGEKVARAAFVACISHFCRSQLMLFSDPEHWPRLKIVRCGIDPARYGGEAEGRGGDRLLFVGRLAAAKGVRVLLDAFATVRAAHPAATLALVGDGPDRAALEARAQTLGLGPAIAFVGALSQDDVARRLGAADVFVLPSFAEGVPVVLMEAMASRLPVVTTRIAGVPELVEDGVSGFTVAPGDAEALAGRIARLLADPDLRRRMGEAGRAKVEVGFRVATEAARLSVLFAEDGRSSLRGAGGGREGRREGGR